MRQVSTSEWFVAGAGLGRLITVVLMAAAVSIGCRRGDGAPEVSAEVLATSSSASPEPRSSTVDGPTSQKPAVNDNGAVPAWAHGVWHGKGVAKVTALTLPGNQGVQLAWIRDKGVEHVGPVELRLEVARSGAARGKLSGALGDLEVFGAWPETGPLTLELRPALDGPTVFHGTASLVWGPERGPMQGLLRAARGDGRFVRSADLEVTITSE